MQSERATDRAEPERPCIGLLGPSVLDRLAYRLLLKRELDCEVTVDSGFEPTSVWTAMRAKPDLALVDADPASIEALDAVQMILRLQPTTRILVIGAAVDPMHVQPWSRCKIHGYVVKDGGVEELRRAVAAVLDKRQHFSEGVRDAVRKGLDHSGNGQARLSRRESELLPLLARGLTLREAAQRMTVSYKTADSYRTSLLRKLGLHDRVELARYAIREHIVDP